MSRPYHTHFTWQPSHARGSHHYNSIMFCTYIYDSSQEFWSFKSALITGFIHLLDLAILVYLFIHYINSKRKYDW